MNPNTFAASARRGAAVVLVSVALLVIAAPVASAGPYVAHTQEFPQPFLWTYCFVEVDAKSQYIGEWSATLYCQPVI